MSIILFNGARIKNDPMNSLGPPKEKVRQIRFKRHPFLTTTKGTDTSENLTK